jgi:Flp pilus assembly protein CpaB
MFNFLKGRWTLWIIAMVFAGLAAGGSLLVLGGATETRTYWVLNEDVPAGVEITSEMLFKKESSVEGAPGQALTAEEFSSATWYSKIPLSRGTVLQGSVLTDNRDFNDDLPAGYVVTSILVEPQDAAGGRISKGSFIDIAAVSGNDLGSAVAKVVLQRVLVLDVTVSPDDIADVANSSGRDLSELGSAALYAGKPSMYILAVSPLDFAKLALIKDSNLYLALSADQSSPVDTTVRGSDLFLPGAVEPSFGDAPVSNNNGSDNTGNSETEVDTKGIVESFYNLYIEDNTFELETVAGSLVVVDSDGNVVDSVSLGGGSIDLVTGVWTAG